MWSGMSLLQERQPQAAGPVRARAQRGGLPEAGARVGAPRLAELPQSAHSKHLQRHEGPPLALRAMRHVVGAAEAAEAVALRRVPGKHALLPHAFQIQWHRPLQRSKSLKKAAAVRPLLAVLAVGVAAAAGPAAVGVLLAAVPPEGAALPRAAAICAAEGGHSHLPSLAGWTVILASCAAVAAKAVVLDGVPEVAARRPRAGRVQLRGARSSGRSSLPRFCLVASGLSRRLLLPRSPAAVAEPLAGKLAVRFTSAAQARAPVAVLASVLVVGGRHAQPLTRSPCRAQPCAR
mmetsp:Transcript_82948/g.243216  ORF Transcript_82948/g.243216 Transcript_82948/m.243216 type:complete len:291 (+) Transcript_82948:961-1833(+)